MVTLCMNNGLVNYWRFSPHSTFLTGHSVSMHPAEWWHCYRLPQWSAAGDAPLHSWGSRQHESPSPLAKGLPQAFQVWSTPETSDTACIHTVSHDEYSYCCTVERQSNFILQIEDLLMSQICTPHMSHVNKYFCKWLKIKDPQKIWCGLSRSTLLKSSLTGSTLARSVLPRSTQIFSKSTHASYME